MKLLKSGTQLSTAYAIPKYVGLWIKLVHDLALGPALLKLNW